MFGVTTARLGMVLLGVAGMAMNAMGVVRRLLMIACLVMPGGFAVMPGRMLMMFGGLVMMLDGVLAHKSSPGSDS